MPSRSGSSFDDASERRFQKHIENMKASIAEQDIIKAVEHAETALTIRSSEKLTKKLATMKKYLADIDEEVGGDMDDLGCGLYVQKEVSRKLYDYQKDGLRWLWLLFRQNKGGILGDDMGLGKTVQIIVFLAALFDLQKIKTVLIIMPVSLIVNWENEFNKWAGDMKVFDYHGATKRQRETIIEKVQRRGGIVLTTYGTLVAGADMFIRDVYNRGKSFVWDYVILDEGHKIKNPTKCTKGAHSIPSRNRIILTGTPIQNNLMELWSLYDFVQMGGLLGTVRTFKMEFEAPIKRSREKDATVGEKRLGNEMAVALRKKIEPYFLRRTKAEVMGATGNKENEGGSTCSRPAVLRRKNDFVVWTFLSKEQVRIYNDFLQQEVVKEVLMTKRSPLVEINVMKKICDHPRLLTAEACRSLGLDDSQSGNNDTGVNYDHVSDTVLMEESGKMKFLIQLLHNLRDEGHRCLVFSQSRRILDIAQRILSNRRIYCLRIDGQVKSSQERQDIIDKFNRNERYTVFLLTSQVGGVGLTITSADRVVIFDPSWNPATDSQAIDRCYRIGQKNAVVVYRLITCGTVEEKIYRRQVFKQSLHKQTTEGDKNPFRYFRNQELYELFTLDNTSRSTTQIQLEQMHAANRNTDVHLDEHIAVLYSFDIFGISDHDLLFTIAPGDDEESDSKVQQYIDAKVKRAEEIVSIECELNDMAIKAGEHVKPNLPDTEDNFVNRRVRERPPLIEKPASFRIVNSVVRQSHESSRHSSESEVGIVSVADQKNSTLQPVELVSRSMPLAPDDGNDDGDSVQVITPSISPPRSELHSVLVSDTDDEEEASDSSNSTDTKPDHSQYQSPKDETHKNNSRKRSLMVVAETDDEETEPEIDEEHDSLNRCLKALDISNDIMDSSFSSSNEGGSPNDVASPNDSGRERARMLRRSSMMVNLQHRLTSDDDSDDDDDGDTSVVDESEYESVSENVSSSSTETEDEAVVVQSKKRGVRRVIESDDSD